MRVPQVNERVKEAPAHALRAMFAGIGQLLSVTDKLRGKPTQAPAAAETAAKAPETAAKAPETAAANGAAAAPETVVTTEAVTAEKPAPETTAEAAAPAAPAAPKPKPATAATAAPKPKPKPKPATPDAVPPTGNVKLIPSEKAAAEAVPAEPAAAAEPAVAAEPAAAEVTPAADLPLANYDSLTIASLRARLRNLSAAQLGQLIAYEKAHAARADVIAMFERRVAKLESES